MRPKCQGGTAEEEGSRAVDVGQLIEAMIGVETRLSRLYGRLALHFPNDPQVAAIWHTLSTDESQHALNLTVLRAMAQVGAKAPGSLSWNSAAVEEALAKLGEYERRVESGPVSLVEALTIAVALEASEIDVVYHVLLDAFDRPLPEVLTRFSASTEEHLNRLVAAVDRLGRDEVSRTLRGLTATIRSR